MERQYYTEGKIAVELQIIELFKLQILQESHRRFGFVGYKRYVFL